ncbi:MAG: NAD-dependent epimerase/dehydratase family protein [Pseudonocardiaceae bacterium]
MKSAIVLGGSGFIGSACVAALRGAGWYARAEPAPRLTTRARSPRELTSELPHHKATIDRLAEVLDSTDVVINAGGMPANNASDSDDLFGANSLLPGVVAFAARQAGVRRFIHLSSISVQGRMDPLDETMRHHVHSPYSSSRSLGEQIIEGPEHDHTVILRLLSVHGVARAGTWRLNRIAHSPFSSTAGRGDRPTPLALIENVGAAVEFLAAYEGNVPKVVLQPTEGITTGDVLELLGDRKPRHVPVRLAKPLTTLLLLAGRRSRRAHTLGRGIELLWLGQGQKRSWLTEAGFVSPVGAEGWAAMGRALNLSKSAT